MAVKKAVKKVVAKKAVAAKSAVMTKKKALVKKAAAKSVTSKGDLYECEECGLVLTVWDVCDCDDECDVVCCGESMTRTSKKAKK